MDFAGFSWPRRLSGVDRTLRPRKRAFRKECPVLGEEPTSDVSRCQENLPKAFRDLRFLLTRYESGNDLHRAMFDAFRKVFGNRVAEHPIEMTRAVEQSGRFLSSVYEIDYRVMSR